MTATSVNGLEVIADEPTQAPIATRNGKPLLWYQTRTLLLEDGSTTYGCVHCDYTSSNLLSIRPHLGVHTPRTKQPKRKSAGANTPVLDLIQQLQEFQEVAAEREEWRTRALRAEQALASIRKALKEEK